MLFRSNIYVSTINTGPVSSNFRKNAIINFNKNVVVEGSYFQESYKKELVEYKQKDKDFFTTDSSVVIKNIIHALESKKPRPRYYNTLATHLLGGLKRILSTNILDKILVKI